MNCVCNECSAQHVLWRNPSNAGHQGSAERVFRVTHPFHPLSGREFELLEQRWAWGELRVYFHDDEGKLRRMPASWTDIGDADPHVVLAGGRSFFRLEDLIRLADLVGQIRSNPHDSDGTV